MAGIITAGIVNPGQPSGGGSKRGRGQRDYDSTGRRRWETVEGSVEDAEDARAKVLGRKHRGERVARSKLTVGEAIDAWLDVKAATLRPRTVDVYRTSLQTHVRPTFGRNEAGSDRRGCGRSVRRRVAIGGPRAEHDQGRADAALGPGRVGAAARDGRSESGGSVGARGASADRATGADGTRLCRDREAARRRAISSNLGAPIEKNRRSRTPSSNLGPAKRITSAGLKHSSSLRPLSE